MTRHPWWSPSAWASSFLFAVAIRAPNDADLIVAALYGIVEVCGIKRIIKLGYNNRRIIVIGLQNILRKKLAKKDIS